MNRLYIHPHKQECFEISKEGNKYILSSNNVSLVQNWQQLRRLCLPVALDPQPDVSNSFFSWSRVWSVEWKDTMEEKLKNYGPLRDGNIVTIVPHLNPWKIFIDDLLNLNLFGDRPEYEVMITKVMTLRRYFGLMDFVNFLDYTNIDELTDDRVPEFQNPDTYIWLYLLEKRSTK